MEQSKLYTLLTSFVDEEYRTDNFFKGLEYKENYKVFQTLLKDLMNLYPLNNIEVTGGFDYYADGDDDYYEYKVTFTYLSLKNNIDGLVDKISEILVTYIDDYELIEDYNLVLDEEAEEVIILID